MQEKKFNHKPEETLFHKQIQLHQQLWQTCQKLKHDKKTTFFQQKNSKDVRGSDIVKATSVIYGSIKNSMQHKLVNIWLGF